MYKYIFSLLILLSVSCGKEHHEFLNHFDAMPGMPTSEGFKKHRPLTQNDTIPKDILVRVFQLNVNDVELNSQCHKNTYYYFGKYKLNDNFYIIGYDKYAGVFEDKENVFAIYDIENQCIKSKIILQGESDIYRTTTYSNGIFTVKSVFVRIHNGQDPMPGHEYISKEIVEKYKINSNFMFEKID